MKKLHYFIFFLTLFVISCKKETIEPITVNQIKNGESGGNLESSPNINLSQYLDGQYSVYRTQINGNNTYYFNSPTFLVFLSSYGLESPNVFDYNSNGFVDASDFNSTLSGFGNQYIPNYDINSITIELQFSSGWILIIPGWEVAFLKVTPWDENPPGNFIPDNLKSFFLEGINESGDSVKIWYYKIS